MKKAAAITKIKMAVSAFPLLILPLLLASCGGGGGGGTLSYVPQNMARECPNGPVAGRVAGRTAYATGTITYDAVWCIQIHESGSQIPILKNGTVSITSGGSKSFKAIVYDAGCADLTSYFSGDISWTISNTSLGTFTSSGDTAGLSAATTSSSITGYITVTLRNGSEVVKQDTITVVVGQSGGGGGGGTGQASALSAGYDHTCVVLSSGGVKCWGYNELGQLGDGSFTNRLTPVSVSGLSGVSSVAAGGDHTCALISSNGSVKCWGDNSFSQLGNGTTVEGSATPVSVSGLWGATSISAGEGDHTCTTMSATYDGGVKCWGGNETGQLGDGTTTDRNTPVSVSGLSSIPIVSAGMNHTCALSLNPSDMGVKCWGYNTDGRLGDGTTTQRNTPVSVSGLSGADALAAGSAFTCALYVGGVQCWGSNSTGQIGNGGDTMYNQLTPVSVTGLSSGVTDISAGIAHACALLSGGTVKCWGNNEFGQLGDGTTTMRTTPVAVSGLSGVSAVSAGGYHTCALLSTGGVECWGKNVDGQLGDGTTTNSLIPVTVSGFSAADILAPAAPTGLTATAGDTTVDLSWTAPTKNSDGSSLTDLAGYNVYRSTTSGSGYAKINTSTVTSAAYSDTGLTNGTAYYYVVTAIDGESTPNESANSTEVSATPQTPADTTAPAAPTGLTATAGDASVSLSWTAPTTNIDGTTLTDLAGYNVYRSTTSGSGYAKINTSTVTSAAYSDTGLTNGTAYYYVVTAIDGESTPNESAYSSESSATPVAASSAVVTTLAGSGIEGYADGTGAAAQFYNPDGVAVDSSGNVYVADTTNNRIRKITLAGVVTTLAGSGIAGFADGTGTAARFYVPSDVAVDSSGNVYVADYLNQKIRKISPSGVVTTLAGSGIAGSADGTGTAAQFNYPNGVAVDSSGNVYVAGFGSHKIRKVTPSGVVTTLAGSSAGYVDGTGTAAQFHYPRGVAVDSSGNVYVADSTNHCIRKITSAGDVTTLAGFSYVGSYADGTGTAAKFYGPSGVAVDSSGNVYVGDTGNQRIRKITPAGVVTTLAGSGTAGFADGTGTAAQFNNPTGVAIDSSGNVYVADGNNHRIRKITP